LLLAHPTWSGTLFAPGHGIAPEVVYGELLRLLGADGVIYVNPGGRFAVAEELTLEVNRRLRRPWEGIRAAFPAPGGGIQVDTVPHWVERYGPDTLFLVGGSLYQAGGREGGLEMATRRLMQALAAAGRPA
ncbi:MAG TPA: ribulose 1,5-bisphosphate carboxylase, partial [Thermoanaerobaculia bacterium]|nr:ribulose 1,5-bisphosphate carboxylase [Thermoanaerobaculia bacterium]